MGFIDLATTFDISLVHFKTLHLWVRKSHTLKLDGELRAGNEMFRCREVPKVSLQKVYQLIYAAKVSHTFLFLVEF